MITPSGEICSGLKDLKDRAIKAFMKLTTLFQHFPLVSRKLFDALIVKINIGLPPSNLQEETIKHIFSTDDFTALNALGKFISEALQKRENMTFYTLPPHYILYKHNDK